MVYTIENITKCYTPGEHSIKQYLVLAMEVQIQYKVTETTFQC